MIEELEKVARIKLTKEEKEKELERCYKIIEEQEAEFSMDVLEAYRKYNQSINRYYYIKNKILEVNIACKLSIRTFELGD